jgi:hypothetical protein
MDIKSTKNKSIKGKKETLLCGCMTGLKQDSLKLKEY